MRIVPFFMIAAAVVPLVAADKPIETLKPSGKWHLDYGVNRCHMARSFGEGKKSVIVRMVRYAPEDKFALDLIGERFSYQTGYPEVILDFNHDGSVSKREAFRGKMGKVNMLAISSARLMDTPSEIIDPSLIEKLTPADETLVNSVYVRVNRGKPFKLALGSMGPAMKAMRACTDDMLKSWGYDPVDHASISRLPILKPDSGALLSDDDYPLRAVSSGSIGLVQFRLDVDPNGSVSGCNILAETSPADFSSVVCKKVSKRAKFDPALDKAGNPIRSFYVQTVRFKI